MSLRWKLVLLFSVVYGLFILMAHAVMQSTVLPGFARLEQKEAIKDAQRCTDALNREVHSLATFVMTWSAWDDAYAFMADHNTAFIKSNCPPETYTNNNLNLIWFVNNDGSLVWGETRDDHDGKPIVLADFSPRQLGPHNALVHFKGPMDMTGGVVVTDHGPMIIVARPIVTSHNEGPIHGSLIMGRILGREEIEELNEQTHVMLNIWPARVGSVPGPLRPYLASAQAGRATLVEQSDELLYAYTIVNDIFGQPGLLLRADVPRSITTSGRQAAWAALCLSIAGAAIILLALWGLTQIVVVWPLRRMAAHMAQIGQSEDLKQRLNLRRHDEIGLLADQFDMMVQSLAESRARGVEAARRNGMLDIATDVLHNVGNAINTVNVSAEVMDQRLRGSKLPGLSKTAELLKEHQQNLPQFLSDDPRGTRIVEYLCDLSEVMSGEQQQSLGDLQRLREKVGHIRGIISHQLENARTATFTPDQKIATVVDAVLRLNAETIEKQKITVALELDEQLDIPMHKVKFMQIMNNLVQNALEAVEPEKGRLTIRASTDEHFARIEVSDNGMGIDPAILPQLSRHGYTTKLNGHGFGLHYCANAVRQMGGKLTIRSEGVGKGATFALSVPLVGTLDLDLIEELDEPVSAR